MIEELVSAVRSVLPPVRPIEHHTPLHTVHRRTSPQDYGAVKIFEDKLREITGAEQVIATSSGTAAFHVMLMIAGVKPNDEVIVPSMTYVATANAVVHAGAVPHFIDSGITLNPFKLRQYIGNNTDRAEDRIGRVNRVTGRRISAVIPCHILGQPCDMTGINEVATSYGLIVLEDAAEALGSSQGNQACGTTGLMGFLSFNNNKIVTTSGGGAILTNDPYLAANATNLIHVARTKHDWLVEHDQIAWNYPIGNINASYGITQLEKFDEIIRRKAKLADKYRQALGGVRGCRFLEPTRVSTDVSNNWLSAVVVDRGKRDAVLAALHAEGIRARALFTPLHKLPMYLTHPRSTKHMLESELLFDTVICLPSGPGLVS